MTITPGKSMKTTVKKKNEAILHSNVLSFNCLCKENAELCPYERTLICRATEEH